MVIALISEELGLPQSSLLRALSACRPGGNVSVAASVYTFAMVVTRRAGRVGILSSPL